MTGVLQTDGTEITMDLLASGLDLAGLALLAGLVSLAVSLFYRWYAREAIPEGVAILVGLGAVSVGLNTLAALSQAIIGRAELLTPRAAFYTLLAFVVSGVAADLGRRGGDYLATEFFAFVGGGSLERDVGELVRTGGRVITVTLPDEVADIDGYEPVAPKTKAAIAGETLLFPRRLTVAELESRLVDRLREDYGVGQVDVDLTADGEVDHLGVGLREVGLGPTLAPGTAAVAVRADPANTASPGDLVQVWTLSAPEGGEGVSGRTGPRRVTTAELRATAGDVVTLALDERDAVDLGPGEYRLVTLPSEPSADRAFASLLRAADETMGAVAVAAGSPLVGTPLGALDTTVVAVRTEAGDGTEGGEAGTAEGDGGAAQSM